ncbi:hypothetical protein E2C01_004703 [Portunus trituberculatus]|uniref:Uncharacterized protein n=1 Tax=Portunus trituberculatus TaxID=210409 RepID=A0A5B7CUM4_PORTR|nr:hypothetical protein [Portunus trituberculatus]
MKNRSIFLISIASDCQHSALTDIPLEKLPSYYTGLESTGGVLAPFLSGSLNQTPVGAGVPTQRQERWQALRVAQPARSRQRLYLVPLNKAILSPGEVEDQRAATHSTRSPRTRRRRRR